MTCWSAMRADRCSTSRQDASTGRRRATRRRRSRGDDAERAGGTRSEFRPRLARRWATACGSMAYSVVRYRSSDPPPFREVVHRERAEHALRRPCYIDTSEHDAFGHIGDRFRGLRSPAQHSSNRRFRRSVFVQRPASQRAAFVTYVLMSVSRSGLRRS
jgi:hypothetical protein